MKRIYMLLTMLVLLLCANSNTSYAVTLSVFNNATDYNNAVGSQLFMIDFNGSPNAVVVGSTISPYAAFGSPEATNPSQVVWSSNALTDAGSTIAANYVGPLSIDFSSPVFAFALDFLSASEQETLKLYDANNTLIGSVLASNASGFFGLVSDTAIDSVVIINGIFPSTGNPDRFFIDNLHANATAVPEPSTLLLLGSGLLGFGIMGLRKK